MEEKGTVYDEIRFAAIILVVLAHVTRMYTGLGVVTPVVPSKGLALLTTIIYAFHMPLFIFISGAVFGLCIEKGKYRDRAVFLFRKAKRLLLPYLVFGLCYVTPVMVLLHFTDLGFVGYFCDGILLSRNARHLWYILALFLIFCPAILCRDLLKSNWIWLICAVSLLCHFGAEWMPPEFQLRAAASYQVYFFLGVLFNRYYVRAVRLLRLIRITPILFCVLFVLCYRCCYSDGIAGKFVCAAAGIAMVVSLAVFCRRSKWVESVFVRRINQNSYGIYFFHPMIIYILFAMTYRSPVAPWVLSAVIFLVSFSLSYVLTEVVRRVHWGILIGEG